MSIVRLANQFLKSRILFHSCNNSLCYIYVVNLDRLMVEMCKATFEAPEEAFLSDDAMTYYEARFYSYWARHFRP